MNGIRPHAEPKRLKWAIASALACVIFLGGGCVATSDAQQNHPVKQAEIITPVPARAACANVAIGHARCLSYVSLHSYSNPSQAVLPDSSGGYGPAEFHKAYQLPCKPGGPIEEICGTPSSFGPQTIAIVDAGGYGGSLSSDLNTYDNYYGLPACTTANGCLSVLNQSGATSPLPAEVSSGWTKEIALDVETAHMICQTCRIDLVEADDDSVSSLVAAENTAADLAPIAISNSWGSDIDTTAYDSDFKHDGMAIVAATGDNGASSGGISWPADIPQVVAASGTTLQLNTDDSWASEAVWSDSGGGCSTTYSAPSWQTSRSDWSANGCGNGGRAFGDLSADADPDTGAAIVSGSSWYLAGGTSLAAPLIASMYALEGNLPAGTDAVTLPYQNASSTTLHDITFGNDCASSGQPDCTAANGFDVPSGLGSPKNLGLFNPAPIEPSYSSRLSVGGTLVAGQSLGSSATNPSYRLIMQGDGNLVLYAGGHAVWSSRTAHTGSGNHLVMQGDGNLVLYNARGKALWSSGTNTHDNNVRASGLVMQGDGNLVLYTSSGLPAWSTSTGKINLADGTQLQSGHSLTVGQMLGSSLINPSYRLIMQGDGNLVVYKRSRAVWQSHTGGTGSHNALMMQGDGNLVIYTSSGRAVWSSRTDKSPKALRLVMQGDGNLVLYAGGGRAVWSI